jgi:hypothetical protein
MGTKDRAVHFVAAGFLTDNPVCHLRHIASQGPAPSPCEDGKISLLPAARHRIKLIFCYLIKIRCYTKRACRSLLIRDAGYCILSD